jgi:hypothetical protein
MLCKGHSAVFVEFKGSLFRADAKWAGDVALLEHEIRTKLVEKESGDPKGVLQLANAISSVFERQRGLIGPNLGSVTKVYPLLVTYDEIGDAWYLMSYLNEALQTALNKRKMRVTVTPLFCMSADQFEALAGALNSVALSDILQARYKQERSLEMPFWLPNNAALKD